MILLAIPRPVILTIAEKTASARPQHHCSRLKEIENSDPTALDVLWGAR
jgi:hypothetical protein